MKGTKKIEYGDRIYARLMMNGRAILEFMIDRVASMTDLIGELRHMTYGAHGLAMLFIRNQSKGWSQERPFMLYSPSASLRPRREAAPLRSIWDGGTFERRSPDMLFPWETH